MIPLLDIISMEFDGGAITLDVLPESESFEYEWKVNGIIQEDVEDKILSINGRNLSQVSLIEVTVSSLCDSDETSIFLIRDETTSTVFPLLCPTTISSIEPTTIVVPITVIVPTTIVVTSTMASQVTEGNLCLEFTCIQHTQKHTSSGQWLNVSSAKFQFCGGTQLNF